MVDAPPASVCGYEALPARSEAVINLTVIDPMARHLNREHTVCSLVVQPGGAHDCDRSITVATTWWAAEFQPSAPAATSKPEGNEDRGRQWKHPKRSPALWRIVKERRRPHSTAGYRSAAPHIRRAVWSPIVDSSGLQLLATPHPLVATAVEAGWTRCPPLRRSRHGSAHPDPPPTPVPTP